MRILITCAAVILMVSVASCGGGRPEPTVISGVEFPDWFENPFIDGQFGAVGISRPSLGGMAETRARALAQGRVELGRTISTRVQAAYNQWFREGGEIFQEGQDIDTNRMAMEMSENVSRQLTDQVIQGSTSRRAWEHPQTKDLYLWVVIDSDKLEVLQRQVKAQAQQEAQRRSFIRAEIKAEEAFQALDAAIDAQMKRDAGIVE